MRAAGREAGRKTAVTLYSLHFSYVINVSIDVSAHAVLNVKSSMCKKMPCNFAAHL